MSMRHTPEPWRWELNLKSKGIELCGGKPSFDLTVMDFTRWGMGRAAPRVRDKEGLLEPAHKYGKVVEGREHHAEWFQGINHPDMNRIVACVNACAGLNPEALPEVVKLLEYIASDVYCFTLDKATEAAKRALELIKQKP